MTSNRPYRPRLTTEEALTRLRVATGSQLDPSVVDALLVVLGIAVERELRQAS